MVATFGQQQSFTVEALAYVHPHSGSHANRAGLYELVADTNPSVGEESVLDAATERRLGLDAAEEPVALSRLGVDPAATMMCASLPPTRCRGAARTVCTRSSHKGAGDEVNDRCTGRPLAAE
jgi:hypothetical protein